MNSLHARLLLAASLVLAAFLGLTGLTLERAFRESTLTALEEKLQSHVYALLAAAKETETGRMRLPEALPEPRFSRPDSGLYAWVLDGDGGLFWRSASLLGQPLPAVAPVTPGERRFRQQSGWFILAFGVEWEDDEGRGWPYTFFVAEAVAPFEETVGSFRATLWSWLGGLALGLLLAQGFILRWGLAPLRRVERDLRAIQEGRRERLGGDYPAELKGLTGAVDLLLEQGRSAQSRYQHSLDDLAHSLKTPLAFLQAVSEDEESDCERLREVVREQSRRMGDIVAHQLRKAAASGRTTLMKPVPVAGVVERLLAVLEKVHREKNMTVERRLDPRVHFVGDESDLMELLGNLLDNAFKYGRRRVRVTLSCAGRLVLKVEDDGPGIPAGERQRILRRGIRLDENAPGQGLGLAATAEIVRLYQGRLALEEGDLGGLRVTVELPQCRLS